MENGLGPRGLENYIKSCAAMTEQLSPEYFCLFQLGPWPCSC